MNYSDMARWLMNPSMAQPVVFDAWRNKDKGVNSLNTEGARPYYGGWNVRETYGPPGSHEATTVLPSGGTLKIYGTPSEDGTISSQVILGGKRGIERTNGSAKDAIRHFSDAMQAVQDYSLRVKPRQLQWEAGDEGLKNFYDKMFGRVVSQFEGAAGRKSSRYGDYNVYLPNPANYPLKK